MSLVISIQHRVPLILRVVADADSCSGGVFQRVAALLVGQQFGGFEVHAVEGICIEGYLLSAAIDLRVDDAAVGNATVLHQESSSSDLGVLPLFLLKKAEKSHTLI